MSFSRGAGSHGAMMVRYLLVLVFSLFILGCECDSICESGHQTRELLSSFSKELEVVTFLNTYNGEGPGSEKFSTFVKWGARNPSMVVSIISHPQLTEVTLNAVVYAISDMGLSDKYCGIYKKLGNNTDSVKMQKRILGCL